MNILKKEPSTPEDISRIFGISWNTAQNYLLKLCNNKLIKCVKKGRVNIYFLDRPKELKFEIPNWVKSKSLEEISNEIQNYFEDISAQEIVDKERRK
ncbi:MAG: hypothetical protein HWN67_12175 [Candidatus Helarchaeota archaeon]|nr:hypothetical protein [Candidatus Helarchaeota archaeon]